MPPLVTLTTDFQEQDPYAASVKGVLWTHCPGVHIMDLTHEVPRRNILEGALFIAGAIPYFPKGTVHAVVVAPGSANIAVPVDGQFVVCPDNGVITLIAERYPIEEARAITNHGVFARHEGQTFFGRDVLAPAAAHLAAGKPIDELGDRVENPVLLKLPKPRQEGEGRIMGKIMHVDRWGNLVTNIHRSNLEGVAVKDVEVGLFSVGPLVESYTEVELGCPLAIVGATGYVEIAYNGDRADKRLNMGLGIIVKIETEPV